MNLRRFFTETEIKNNTAEIGGEELHHLKNVIRLKVNDCLELVNGKGFLYRGEITEINSNSAKVRVKVIKKEGKSRGKIIIAPSLLSRRAMNILIEKLSEIGISEIRPVIFDRTEEKPVESRINKWKKIASSSLKVNGRLWLTDIFPPVNLDDILRYSEKIPAKILLDLAGVFEKNLDLKSSIIVLIGPPGDFLDQERKKILQNGKSETAAISISAILKWYLNT